jgi:nuclear pore complex protein Nup107
MIRSRYVRYLFSEQQEELVGVYASQLERDVCIDLFVEMMELRLNSRYYYICLYPLMFLQSGKYHNIGNSIGCSSCDVLVHDIHVKCY